MCQPKDKGGKRCARHMKGSMATVNTVAKTTKVDRGIVSKVFQEMRSEGAEMRTPTPEEVKAFAELQKVQTSFNPDLSTSEILKIQAQWDEAKEESPDGKTFYAWKNTMFEVMRRGRSRFATFLAIGGLSMGLASCSNGGSLTDPTQIPTTQAPIVTTSPSPVASLDEYGIDWAGTLNDDTFTVGTERTDIYGTYNQVGINDNAAIIKDFDAWDQANAEVKGMYTQEQVNAAQDLTTKFMLQWTLDGPGVYAPSDDATAIIANEAGGLVTQGEYRDGFINSAQTNEVVTNFSYGYDYPQHSTNHARYGLDYYKINKVTALPSIPGTIVFEYKIQTSRPMVKDGVNYNDVTSGTYKYAVVQENGVWKLNGINWDNTTYPTEVE